MPGVGLLDLDGAGKGELVEWLAGKVGDQLELFAARMREGPLAASAAIGLDVMGELMAAEVTELAGPKGKHNPASGTAYRHGDEDGTVVLGGRKLPVRWPRVRGVDGQEVHLASYDTFAQVDLLAAAMLAGSPSEDHPSWRAATCSGVPGRKVPEFTRTEGSALGTHAPKGPLVRVWPRVAGNPRGLRLGARRQELPRVVGVRVVLFVPRAITAFNFFPRTPTQIVVLAILNDAAILTIAYDRVRPSPRPERWDLTEVLSIATVLGLAGVVESFSLVALAVGPLRVSHAEVQTLMYLKLSVAGHLTLFVARTRGRLWSDPHPARVVLIAVIGTQILATLIAASGLLMKPLRWELVGLAWGYAIVWILLLDQIKLWAYKILSKRGREVSLEIGAR